MFIIQSYSLAVVFCFITMLCWGSWANTSITLGAQGVYLATAMEKLFVPALNVDAIDTTGAGDIFCGSFAVALVEGKSVIGAVRFACAASALSVTRLGAQPSAPYRSEIEDLMNRL